MLADCMLGIEELIARTPGLLARLNTPSISNPEVAKAQKIFWDYFDTDADGSGEPDRPFFVLKDSQLDYYVINGDEMTGIVAIDCYYTEVASSPTDHKASKLYFLNFVSSMLDSIAARQSQPIDGQDVTTYITVHHIQMLQHPVRTPKVHRDGDRPPTDNWWCSWRMWIGDFQGAG